MGLFWVSRPCVCSRVGMYESCGVDIGATPTGDRRPWAPHVREANPLTFRPAEPFSCLTEVDLFADLSTAEIAAMDLMAPARMFRAGDLVFSQSQPITALFILKTGRVRVFRVTEDGKALTMAILEPGACLLYTSDAADDLLCVDLGGR